METKAHYALVGFLALAIAAAGALFAVWLGQAEFDRQFAEYDVVFTGPVRGLSEASEVRFNGIKVGEVIRVRLDPEDARRVIAAVRVDAETPVRTDSLAQLEPQGLTGLSYIQISGGSPAAAMLEAPPSGRPRIESRQAQLEFLIEGGEDIVNASLQVLSAVDALLSPQNVSEIGRTLTNLRVMTDTLAEDGAMLETAQAALVELRAAAVALQDAGGEVDAVAGELRVVLAEEITPMLRGTDAASLEVFRAAEEARNVLETIEGPVDRFANEGLDELTLALTDLRRLILSLEAIAAALEEDPAGFVVGSGPREVELPE